MYDVLKYDSWVERSLTSVSSVFSRCNIGSFVLNFRSLSSLNLEFYKAYNFCSTFMNLQIVRILFATSFNVLSNLFKDNMGIVFSSTVVLCLYLHCTDMLMPDNSNFALAALLGIFWPSVCLFGLGRVVLCSFSLFFPRVVVCCAYVNWVQFRFSRNY